MSDQPGSQHASSSIIGRAERFHLKTQLEELQRRYEKLTTRLAAIDTDIGRELDSERKLVLEERRATLVAERDQAVAEMARIEQDLAGSSAATPGGVTIPVVTAPAAALSDDDHASLQRQLAELRGNLRLIEERKSQFVQETDIPLQLIKDERRIRDRINDLENRFGRPE